MNKTSIDILESYIKGKDDDQYQILESIYSTSAELEFEIHSDDISFPSNIMGNHEIAKVLSKDFNQKYDKVKTYYLSKPDSGQLTIHQQNWLVVMRERSNGLTRVGTGYYDWDLIEVENNLQVQKHKISIDSMLQLEDYGSVELNRIQSELKYPWVDPSSVIETLSNNPTFESIVAYLKD